MTKSNNPLVAIRCITYNHEPYIRDALEGFVMQKTNFPFVAIVHDDASTDGTAAIIREYAEKYPDIIKPIYETENQYSKRDGSLGRIMNRASEATGAKYIALCEGDDYWIDPLKLQKQVDFLENNPNYSMIYSRVCRLIQNTGCIIDNWGGNGESFKQLLVNNCIPTPTTIFRQNCFLEYNRVIKPEQHQWRMGDYPIWLFMAATGKVKFQDIETATYRILDTSASHFGTYLDMLKFRMSGNDVKVFMCNQFNVSATTYLAYRYTLKTQIEYLLGDFKVLKESRLRMFWMLFKRNIVFKVRIRMLILIISPKWGTKLLKKREFDY